MFSVERVNWCSGRHSQPFARKRKARIMKTRVNKFGYEQVCLHKDGRASLKTVHRLVAKAFIPNPEGLKEVNHIDEVKHHNSANNLEWTDRSGNAKHSSYKNRGERQSLLTEEEVLLIVAMLPNMSQKEIAEDFGVSSHVVHKIKCGKNWAWLTGLDKEGA